MYLVLLALVGGGVFFSPPLGKDKVPDLHLYSPRHINYLAFQQLLENSLERILRGKECRQKILEAGAGSCHVLCSSDHTSTLRIMYIVHKHLENTQQNLNDFPKYPKSLSERELS